MDGNRRFATHNGMKKVDGHRSGFDKLSQVLTWCKDIGIIELSVYAFSIANFNRSKEEVAYLFELAEEKFQEILDSFHKIEENNLCIRVIGRLDLLPERLQKLSAELMLRTQSFTGSFLNIYMAYTSGDEIATCLEEIRLGLKSNWLTEEDVNEALINETLTCLNTHPVDLLIRTSGEVRLSDFLSWHVSKHASVYSFTSVNWPEFSLWHMLAAVLHFQMNNISNYAPTEISKRAADFLANLNEKRFKQLSKIVG
ncbi:hypothetical protein Ciccas_009485 [Cichlidogyrus casuarinus]|uniref:Alkyl transferase n=1 Tax=Cichlidogyrus casuarinus TaxID=1844966 RepID=A0ABD2Q1D8_9PLAT